MLEVILGVAGNGRVGPTRAEQEHRLAEQRGTERRDLERSARVIKHLNHRERAGRLTREQRRCRQWQRRPRRPRRLDARPEHLQRGVRRGAFSSDDGTVPTQSREVQMPVRYAP